MEPATVLRDGLFLGFFRGFNRRRLPGELQRAIPVLSRVHPLGDHFPDFLDAFAGGIQALAKYWTRRRSQWGNRGAHLSA